MAERITFDASLYLPEAVEVAAEAYAEHAQIDVKPADGAVVVEIAPSGEHDPQALAHAFCNHVLHETIVRRRQSALDEVI